jgi:hypothetical protein
MKWPITKEYQEKFRSRSDWSVVDLIPKQSPDLKCEHGFIFDDKCPKKMGWVQSSCVKIYDLEYTPSDIDRIVYFRPTIGNCTCKQLWSGDIVLNVSKAINKNVHLITYSLLHTYSWLWAKGGLSRRAFLRAHNSRMVDQYGVPETELMTWSVFSSAVKSYNDKVLQIDEQQSALCQTCGPRPSFLCVDGVAIGVLVDKLQVSGQCLFSLSLSLYLSLPLPRSLFFLSLSGQSYPSPISVSLTKFP